ncbi:MAG: SPOR domain-containing protein [Ferrovibrio sp.]|uniref:SPOR domain-containing protein n=1 Tax=Ferrovibrio sp. TaxID=1917215 RepID=UPI00391A6F2B
MPVRRLLAMLGLFALVACAADTAPPAPPVAAEPPPPVAVAPPPPSPPPPPPPNVFAGHVASYKTLLEAEAAWPKLSERFPVMRGAAKRYVEVDLGGDRGKVFRLLLGAFPDRPAAADYCRSLRGAGVYCAPHDLPAPEMPAPTAATPSLLQPAPPPQAATPAPAPAANPPTPAPGPRPAPTPAQGMPASVLKQG